MGQEYFRRGVKPTDGYFEGTVQALTGGSTTPMNDYGVTTITATSAATPYLIGAPTKKGQAKEIYCITATTTNTATVTCSGSGVYFQASTNGALTTVRVATFNGAYHNLALRALSSVAWGIMSNTNGVAFGTT